jgi:hypothetical protein
LYMRNYKSKKNPECLPELEQLIKDVNILPPFSRLKLLKVKLKFGDPAVDEALQDCLKDTPEEFQKHIKRLASIRADPWGNGDHSKENLIDSMAKEYKEFRVFYNSMTTYVRRLEQERNAMEAASKHLENVKKRKVVLTFDHYRFLNWETNPVVLKTVVKRGAGGKPYITGLAGLIGKFDDSRLRRCKICRRIFWAKKTNAETCGLKTCADALGNKKRLAKVESKKQQGEEQNNGTL